MELFTERPNPYVACQLLGFRWGVEEGAGGRVYIELPDGLDASLYATKLRTLADAIDPGHPNQILARLRAAR